MVTAVSCEHPCVLSLSGYSVTEDVLCWCLKLTIMLAAVLVCGGLTSLCHPPVKCSGNSVQVVQYPIRYHLSKKQGLFWQCLYTDEKTTTVCIKLSKFSENKNKK